uniref:Uncharacterized protein n=1 Tax=Arundo donax TaxID=35708 RepID=A0A0A9GGH2_ARUDO
MFRCLLELNSVLARSTFFLMEITCVAMYSP